MPAFLDLKGQKYGKLTVLRRDSEESDRVRWKCLCDCGKEKSVASNLLRSGATRSCGCLGPYGRFDDEFLASKNNLYLIYRINAKNRGITFSLEFEEFIKLTQEKCYYCNQKPSRYFKSATGRKGIFYNGLDRVDNTKGYDLNNVVSCCKYCNFAKADLTQKEFFQWLKKCYYFLNLRNEIRSLT
jgi:hypothetical protein